MRNPVNGRVSSEWARVRRNPATGKVTSHAGIDIAAPTGTEVSAAFAGRVLEVRTNSFHGDQHLWHGLKSGNFVAIQNTDGAVQWYGHLSAVHVKTGEWVKEGQSIGRVGNTGLVTGPHLHFETWSLNKVASNFNPRVLFNRYRLTPGKDGVLGKVQAAAKVYRTVRYGSRNATVGKVQQALMNEGYTKQTRDNVYGAQTRANVLDFQRRTGLVQDGVAGKITQSKLGL